MASKDKDYRLISLVSDVCPLPLRKLFSNLAQSDTNSTLPFTSLNNYMAFRQHDVKKLVQFPPKSIRKDQYDLIYPNADDTQWDVTLLSALLQRLFQSQMVNGEDQLIINIRKTRNKLQHKPGTVVTSDVEFATIWNDIETSTLMLAQIVGGTTYENEIKKLIDEIKINNLPHLGDTLKTWYEDIIVQLRNEIEDLKQMANEGLRNQQAIKVTTSKTLVILKATTVKRKTPSGGKREKSKLLKVDDPVLKKLRGHFDHTMRELPVDFVPHEKMELIQRKLKDNHFVVVTGHENTNYLATALSAVDGSGYNRSRCVEIKQPDDWNHVDPDETDLVLYCEPFLDHKESFQRRKDFQSMYKSATMTEQEARVDVVIVSDNAMVMAWKEHTYTPLFEDVVELYKPTDENNPLNVDKRHHFSNKRVYGDVLENIKAYSETYINQCSSDTFDHPQMETAKAKFKEHKAIVITGPKGSGKTQFAVNLVSSIYEKNQCVVLTEKGEWKHVILGDVSVIIIDDFAGKYKFNASMAEGWLKKFDLIYAAVTQGKLNVIVTCEENIFAKVLKTFAGHALLNNIEKLPSRGYGKVVVKDEPSSPVSDEQVMDGIEEEPAPNVSRKFLKREVPVQPIDEHLPKCKTQPVDVKLDETVTDICEMQDGTLLCIYSGVGHDDKQYFISKFNMKEQIFTQAIKLSHKPRSVSSVGHEFVVFMIGEKMQHGTTDDSGIRLGDIEDLPILPAYQKIILVDGRKYAICTTVTVSIYDQFGNDTRDLVFASDGIPLFYVGTPGNMSKASKNKHITDITAYEDKIFISSKKKIVILNLDDNSLKTFNADASELFVFSEHYLLVRSGYKIMVYSITGEFKRILEVKDVVFGDLFYNRKDKMFFHGFSKKIYCLESS